MDNFDAGDIIAGPAIIKYDGKTYYTTEDISVQITKTFRERNTSAFGTIGQTLLDCTAEITFTPVPDVNYLVAPGGSGSIAQGLLKNLLLNIGQRIYGGTDKPLVIQSIDGKEYTFARAAQTNIPTINTGAENDLIGEVTFTCLRANATAPFAANSIVEIDTVAFADTSFDPANAFSGHEIFHSRWGSTDIETTEGVEITFDFTLEDDVTNGGGIRDKGHTNTIINASFTPVGLTDAEYMDLVRPQSKGSEYDIVRGKQPAVQDLKLCNDPAFAEGILMTLKNAIVVSGNPVFGAATKRNGTVELIATKAFSAGVPQAQFAVEIISD